MRWVGQLWRGGDGCTGDRMLKMELPAKRKRVASKSWVRYVVGADMRVVGVQRTGDEK